MSSEDDTLSSLERAREKLYRSNAKQRPVVDEMFVRASKETPHGWQNTEPAKPEKPHRHVRVALGFFWVALAFFIIASAAAAYLIFSGDRSVSTANVPITIQGPTNIAGGDTVALQISVANNNPAAIKNVKLVLSFPRGTRSVANVLTPLTNDTEDLGTIAPGGHIERTVKAVLFGGQGDTLTVATTLQFQTNGSNATFVTHKNYTLSVIATPLSVSVDAPAQVIAGTPFTLKATVRSNATAPLSGVVLQANYPTGFTPTHTSSKPIGNIFPIGTIAPGATSTVTITGTLAGQKGEQRVMRFTVGTAASAAGASIAVAYMTQRASMTITRPFLATTLSINSGSAEHAVMAPGARANVSLAWINTLGVPVNNARISVALSGSALDPASVTVSNGQYQSSDQTVVFSRDSTPSFASLPPGAQGYATFSFASLSADSASSTNEVSPNITLSVTVSGQYPGQDNIVQNGTVTLSKTIKVTTALAANAFALHTSGPFYNTGPIPPVANKQTLYTIIWNVRNTTNDVAGARVAANLPTDVRFVGPTSPNNGSIVYDNGAHTVAWTIGDLSARASKQAAFQVALTPSTSQRGTGPLLVGPATFSSFDRYAQVTISQTMPAVTTNLSHDPEYRTQVGAGNVR